MTRKSDEEIERNIAYQAEMKADWAVAYAILKLARATQNLAHAVEVVVGTELAGIGISIRDKL